MERAKLLMTLEQEQEASAAVQSSEVTLLKDQIALLTELVAALSTKQNRQPASMLCYQCHQPGHLQRNCPAVRRCFNCGQPGHLARECRSRNANGAPQELTRPPSGVGSVVVVAAVRSSAAVIKGNLAQRELDMMVDSGSSISLIEESVAKAYVAKTEVPLKDFSWSKERRYLF